MSEADTIRQKRLEYNIESLEKENEALRKEIFKYKLKHGDAKTIEEESAQDIIREIRKKKIRKKREQHKKEDMYKPFGALND